MPQSISGVFMTTYTHTHKQSRMNRQQRLTPATKADIADRILFISCIIILFGVWCDTENWVAYKARKNCFGQVQRRIGFLKFWERIGVCVTDLEWLELSHWSDYAVIGYDSKVDWIPGFLGFSEWNLILIAQIEELQKPFPIMGIQWYQTWPDILGTEVRKFVF